MKISEISDYTPDLPARQVSRAKVVDGEHPALRPTISGSLKHQAPCTHFGAHCNWRLDQARHWPHAAATCAKSLGVVLRELGAASSRTLLILD